MDQKRMLHELLSAAQSAGVIVREVSLSEKEHLARSGLVILKGQPVLFMDVGLGVSERLQIIATALRNMDLDNVYLSPAARYAIEGRGPAEKI